MKRTLTLLLAICHFQFNQLQACECPHTELSMAECEKYTIIFRGRVESVAPCGDKPGEAVFEVLELFKGNITATFKVTFNCGGDCELGFKPGEEWILYTRHRQINNAQMDWCSRSRKFYKSEKEDFYTFNYGNDYFEELNFLRKQLGLHRPVSKDLAGDENRNIKPDKYQTIIILFVSLGTILLFYWLFNKYFR